MGTVEKFCLRWNDFESNISGAFKELREDKDFFDVTLACDDDQIQAHKVILSACSPFFRGILRRNRHEHPLLYLKGVKFADLVSVLNFMYHGEVNVAQEELNSFLAVAEDLKVKGLTQNSSTKSSKDRLDLPSKKHIREPPAPATSHVPIPTKRCHPSAPPPAQDYMAHPPAPPYHQDDNDIQEVIPVKTEPLTAPSETPPTPYTAMVEQTYPDPTQQQQAGILADNSMEEYGVEEYNDYAEYEGMEADYSTTGAQVPDGNKELDDMIAQSMSLVVDETGSRLWNCDLCNRTNKDKTDIRRHMEKHFKVKHSCPHCDKQAPSREALRVHIYRHHRQ